MPILLILQFMCSATARPAPDAFIDEIEGLRQEFGVPAVGLVVVVNDEVLLQRSWGLSDVANGREVDADTVWRIGSLTKAFTGLAALQAEAAGQLSLDDRADQFLPGLFENEWSATHPVRIVNLLEHSAGFLDISEAEFGHSDPGPISLQDALSLGSKHRHVQWQPGLQHSYSNAGFGLVSRVLELATDSEFEALIGQRIFEPLGMHSSSFFKTPHVSARLPVGYQADGQTEIPYWHMIYRGFGAINAPLSDLSRWLRVLMADGRLGDTQLFPASMLLRMRQPTSTAAAQSGLRHGYGLGLYAWQRHGHRFVGHGGDADGYLARLGFLPDAGRGYILLINAFNQRALRAMQRRIEHMLVTDLAPPLEPPVAGDADLGRFAGHYVPSSRRFRWSSNQKADLVITVVGDRLECKLDKQRFTLVPVTWTQFREPGQTEATATFIEHAEFGLLLQSARGNYRAATAPPVAANISAAQQ